MKAVKKVHYRNLRLFVNAGISYPDCRANAKLMNMELDVEVTAIPTKVTCEKCLKRMGKKA